MPLEKVDNSKSNMEDFGGPPLNVKLLAIRFAPTKSILNSC